MTERKDRRRTRLGQTTARGVALFGSLALLSDAAWAQSRQVIRADAPQALVVPVSARATAMGGAYLGGDDADVLFFNPAALTSARGLSVQGGGYQDAASLVSVAGATTIGKWSIGVGARALRWADAPLEAIPAGGSRVAHSTTEAPQFGLWRSLGGEATASVTVGVARRLFGLKVGGALHAADDFGARLARGARRGDGVFADLAATLDAGPGALSVVAQHLGRDPDAEGSVNVVRTLERRAPRRLVVGYGVPLQPLLAHLDLGGNVLVSVERDGFVATRGGVEAGYAPVDGVSFIGRLGTVRRRETGLAVTLGAGILVDRVGIDMAFEPDGNNAGWRLGMRIR
jgi:hypothetical protein